MKYKIYDIKNKKYVDLTKYCVNGFGDIMTTKGLVLMNKDDFRIVIESSILETIDPEMVGMVKLSGLFVSHQCTECGHRTHWEKSPFQRKFGVDPEKWIGKEIKCSNCDQTSIIQGVK